MSQQSAESKKEKSTFVTILQIVAPVIGVIMVAYFGYLGIYRPRQLEISATQTAEARAAIPTDTPTPEGEPKSTLTPVPQTDILTPARIPEIQEDCLPFNTNNVSVQPDDSRWLLTDGRSRMLLFDNQQEAQQSLNTIQYYGMNSHCFVGRPNSSFEYWLVNSRAPEGSIANEDCLSFNLSEIAVTKANGSWKIVEGGTHWMFDFADKESEARQALIIIEKYGFTHTCFVGRPNPDFQYLRN